MRLHLRASELPFARQPSPRVQPYASYVPSRCIHPRRAVYFARGAMHRYAWKGDRCQSTFWVPASLLRVCACRFQGILYKATVIGTRLSPAVSVLCVSLAIATLFFKN
jgi:hypothetical protein